MTRTLPDLPTDEGAHPVAGASHAPGYRARRTLPIRVETVRQFRRRRTLFMIGLLLALPWILVAAFKIGGDPKADAVPTLVDVATQSALNFTAFTLFVSTGFLLVVAVALFCGDTVAGEASWSSLRYLLAAPVPRARLLWVKLVVALGYSVLALVLLPLMAMIAGTIAFGWGPLDLPVGASLPTGEALGRMSVVVGYGIVAQLVVMGIAFWLSTVTDAPLGAVGGAVGLVVVSNIVDAVTALGSWRDYLPTHWQFAWVDVLQPDPQWDGMIKGTAVSVAYALVFLALAFRHFGRKDIVS
ncbi:ABC transporter permease subunit [Streptomyces sp. SID3343]|uniref:ABC transporter permease n=1 Tax=Streptomyces sp. SID3343 TaxID=2690260 RepID=UPI001369CC0D|nr:ABC transporter permease subunit [Streptomyces sp. SID3343]MYV98239.1 ABC transporter permease subunit [Streptomyces sp. SID3343]